jgi:hypothetical protein
MWITRTVLLPRYLRLALAPGFLTSVSDRFGLWGAPGRPNVAWRDFQRFAFALAIVAAPRLEVTPR